MAYSGQTTKTIRRAASRISLEPDVPSFSPPDQPWQGVQNVRTMLSSSKYQWLISLASTHWATSWSGPRFAFNSLIVCGSTSHACAGFIPYLRGALVNAPYDPHAISDTTSSLYWSWTLMGPLRMILKPLEWICVVVRTMVSLLVPEYATHLSTHISPCRWQGAGHHESGTLTVPPRKLYSLPTRTLGPHSS